MALDVQELLCIGILTFLNFLFPEKFIHGVFDFPLKIFPISFSYFQLISSEKKHFHFAYAAYTFHFPPCYIYFYNMHVIPVREAFPHFCRSFNGNSFTVFWYFQFFFHFPSHLSIFFFITASSKKELTVFLSKYVKSFPPSLLFPRKKFFSFSMVNFKDNFFNFPSDFPEGNTFSFSQWFRGRFFSLPSHIFLHKRGNVPGSFFWLFYINFYKFCSIRLNAFSVKHTALPLPAI